MICPVCGYSTNKKQRSNNQNRYMHGIVFKLIADEIGENDVKKVKELMKRKFLTIERIYPTKTGKVIIEEEVRNTSDLNTSEMEDFLTRCRNWAHEFLNINIPLPNEE